ncbi:phospholipid scramblase 1 [Calliopsis andreniformis]|uniref:phospholipid scramblase 1 n=1 Tax=Calliopsis andreniformis TaxID=337506 RepID=UPI003FCCAA0B
MASFQNIGLQPPPYSPAQPIVTAPAPNAFPMPTLNMPKPEMPMSMSMPMPMPMPPAGGWSQQNTIYPPGLEYLMALDHLFVVQKVELLEAFTGFETRNKYSVVNIRGEPVFYVVEKSSCCARCCLGSYRNCEFEVFDSSRRTILRMVRPCRCDSCCCPCCLQELQVYSGDTLLGSVTQDWTCWQPSFSVRDATGQTVLTIKGPWFKCCVNVTFKVRSADGEHRVGVIKKEWSGIGREMFTDSDNFGISFPLDLDVKIKAVLLGACLLIDFMYFEGESSNTLGSYMSATTLCCLFNDS